MGVLGGMGPAATVDFMARMLALTPAEKDQDHIHLLVDQDPTVPNRQDGLRGDGEDPGPHLAAMARRLEAAGCDLLVMPCNTAHAYQAHIEVATSIPFVSIIDATLDAAGTGACVGIMATTGCVDSGVFQSALQARDMACVMPTGEEARAATALAFDIKRGRKGAAEKAAAVRLAGALHERGATLIVAACTEIPLVLEQADLDVPLLSSTDELAKRVIAMARQ